MKWRKRMRSIRRRLYQLGHCCESKRHMAKAHLVNADLKTTGVLRICGTTAMHIIS